MPVTLTVCDETAAGKAFNERPLELPNERVTVRDLIRERVYQEVQDFNRQSNAHVFRGLVQPSETECTLNGSKPEFHFKQRREIDWKEQFERALKAFENNAFLLLVDDRQAESLEESFAVCTGTKVAFVKLTPLVGG
ncbi:MAG: hypothetical protein KDA61_22595 [Planctomycetales bacterium]|nr:hypothetical protein [Planctomycetales bacterium]